MNTRAKHVSRRTKKSGGRVGNNQAHTRGRGKNRHKHCDNRHAGNNQEMQTA